MVCHAPRERVSWNLQVRRKLFQWYQSRSTWACELKSFLLVRPLISTPSRSTWACELKWQRKSLQRKNLRHAPRERVSWNTHINNVFKIFRCHAPRERVSWNDTSITAGKTTFVTLHVSVWVEISVLWFSQWLYAVTLHVSVWVEIKVKKWKEVNYNVTLHVSVWVEMENSTNKRRIRMSRSTWACELKYTLMLKCFLWAGHAPRERVSWNV